jgi:hypothetical protein
MVTIDAVFHANTQYMFRDSNSDEEAAFLIDENSSVAKLFDNLTQS